MSAGGNKQLPAGGVQKTLIVLLLVVGVVVLHNFAARTVGFDPSAMLALGFVILASYAFGALIERFGLPHITGYLVAGLLLGPSIAGFIPAPYNLPPFDEGLLSESVQIQLSPLKVLAVGLIALTAGGELKLETLRKGFGTILGVLGGQVIAIILISCAFIFAVSGVIPGIALPGLGTLDMTAALALGALVGAISIATSPAATIAVINDVKARGRVTTSVLGTVVLKDVVVVVLFSILGTFAVQAVSGEGSEGSVGLYLLKHIGGGLALGVIVGGLMAAYLRYVNREVLLFLVGTVFTAAFVAEQLHVEQVVLFITAGFVAANFSSEGEHLLEQVETLSLPVYVVFFTLAGAHLDLVELGRVAPFAFALVALRIGGIWVGTQLGGRVGGAPEDVRRHGWPGFISQAGVAISLAGIMASEQMGLGDAGRSLSTLIIAGIAINELIGPIALKVGLTRAGETAAADGTNGADTPEPAEQTADDALKEWPLPQKGADAWGPRLEVSSRELMGVMHDLQLDLGHLSRDVAEEPLAHFHEAALEYIRELRREFLRHHRRITVQATDDATELNASEALRLEQAELAEKWRAAVLSRGARVRQTPGWDPAPIVAAVDAITEGLPEEIEAKYEVATFEPKGSDSMLRSTARGWLRLRRWARGLFGGQLRPRTVELRALARFHLWGHLPERLEPVAALYAQAETHLVARTRSIFEGLVIAYDELATETEASGATVVPVEPLDEVRLQVDEELMLAVQEVDRIRDDLALRTSLAIGRCLADLKADLPHIDTPDLPMRRRAASKLYKKRDEALRWLTRGSVGARETAAAVYSRLALEMELHALEGRVKDSLVEHARGLGADVRGRAHRQVGRVLEAILESENNLKEVLADTSLGAPALAERIGTVCEPIVRVSAEAARLANLLRDQLSDESSVTPVLDRLTRAAQGLTDHYVIPAGPMPRGEHKLPPLVGTVEVPFRDWVLARIETALAPRLLASTREVALKVEPLSASLSELERRVAFNVELAVNELDVIDDAVPRETHALVGEMIGGALDRNRQLFASFSVESESWGEEVTESVRDAVLSSLDELRGGLVDGEVGRMRSRMVRDVRGQRVVRISRELREALGRAWNIIARAITETIGEERLDKTRAAIGLPVRLADDEIHEHTFARTVAKSTIPMVYRRLFSAQALEAGDILTGRDEALSHAMSLLEGAAGETLRTVAVVGPDGVGKSGFVSAVVRAKRWSKVRELKLRGPATIEQVDALFEPGSEGHLVLISGLQWLSSMKPGGLQPLRRFVARVVADGGKNAFLVRADGLVWKQHCAAAPLASAFPEVVNLDPLDEDELEAAVLARHTMSGYGLVFGHGMTPRSRLEEIVLQGTSPLSRPKQSFFRALHAASGGLLRDALRLWLASVDEVDDAGDFVHLGLVPPASIYALRRLSDEDVLTLYQCARQGWMNPEVLASMYRTDLATAEAKLLALEHSDILDRVDEVWRIAEHLRGSVHRLLDERGFVR